MRYIGIIILLVLCLILLLFTGCMAKTVKTEPAGSSTGPIYEPGKEDTEEPGTVYPQKWATGTGTVGDPWAGNCLEDAYDACPAGGTIYLRAGYYLLDDIFLIAKPISFIGEGMGKTFVVTADATGFRIDDTDYVTIKDMTIDGAAQEDNAEWNSCIFAHQAVNYLLIENVEAKNGGYYGIGLFDNL